MMSSSVASKRFLATAASTSCRWTTPTRSSGSTSKTGTRLCLPSSSSSAASRALTPAASVNTTGRGVMTSFAVRVSSASTLRMTLASCGLSVPERRPDPTRVSSSSSETRCS